jgi:RNA polymerase sigma factor (sigma-70 family)
MVKVNDTALNIDLWNGIRSSRLEAVENLYRTLYFDLFNYGIHISGDTEITRDAINDIFLEIWEKRTILPEVSNVKSYLFTYLRRKIFAVIRRAGKSQVATRAFSASYPGHEDSFEEHLVEKQLLHEVKLKVSLALEKLTDRQKQLVQLRYFESLTVEDIARKTGLSAKTVYNTIYNVLKVLSAELAAFLLVLSV